MFRSRSDSTPAFKVYKGTLTWEVFKARPPFKSMYPSPADKSMMLPSFNPEALRSPKAVARSGFRELFRATSSLPRRERVPEPRRSKLKLVPLMGRIVTLLSVASLVTLIVEVPVKSAPRRRILEDSPDLRVQFPASIAGEPVEVTSRELKNSSEESFSSKPVPKAALERTVIRLAETRLEDTLTLRLEAAEKCPPTKEEFITDKEPTTRKLSNPAQVN